MAVTGTWEEINTRDSILIQNFKTSNEKLKDKLKSQNVRNPDRQLHSRKPSF